MVPARGAGRDHRRESACSHRHLKSFPASVKYFCRIYLRQALRLSPFYLPFLPFLPDDQYVFRPQVRMIFFGLTFSARTSSGVFASSIETASTATFPCANAECSDCPAAIAA